MNQQVVAVTVRGSHNFVYSNDEHGKIMIFSLGTDGIYLCKEDQAGARVIINLSSALRVTPSRVTAFDVVQNPTDLTHYITAASVRPGTT